jgi:hypothetical protein
MDITNVKPGPKDILANMGPEIYREAYEKKRSLSVHLESLTPSKDYNDGLDAFQRLLKTAEIITRSDEEKGYWADEFDKFLESPNLRALVPEWMSRQWRRVTRGQPYSTRALYGSDDQAEGSVSRPFVDSPTGRWNTEIAPAIPLGEIIVRTTPITGTSYKQFYLTTDDTQSRMVRIVEGTEIPRVKLVGGDNLIHLYKYGRALEITYEALRRMRIDVVAMHIQRMAVQAEIDKVAIAIDTLVTGDGNSNAATVHTLSSLDPAAPANTLTLTAWLAFRMKFENPYFMTTAFAQEDVALQMFLLNTGSANLPLSMLQANLGQGFQPINPGLADGTRLGWTSDAPASKIVAFDRRVALERFTEVGADIEEVESFIARQTKLMTMTEQEGYGIIDKNATQILNLAA